MNNDKKNRAIDKLGDLVLLKGGKFFCKTVFRYINAIIDSSKFVYDKNLSKLEIILSAKANQYKKELKEFCCNKLGEDFKIDKDVASMANFVLCKKFGLDCEFYLAFAKRCCTKYQKTISQTVKDQVDLYYAFEGLLFYLNCQLLANETPETSEDPNEQDHTHRICLYDTFIKSVITQEALKEVFIKDTENDLKNFADLMDFTTKNRACFLLKDFVHESFFGANDQSDQSNQLYFAQANIPVINLKAVNAQSTVSRYQDG